MPEANFYQYVDYLKKERKIRLLPKESAFVNSIDQHLPSTQNIEVFHKEILALADNDAVVAFNWDTNENLKTALTLV